MPAFVDRFAFAAASYASYRPRYPAHLFEWLAANVADRTHAWDCGTGSGQAAVGLAEHFALVVATDPSSAQLANAEQADRLHYLAMTAERAAIADRAVALVTVAQALHWFDHALFFREVERVLRPDGMLAVWSYGLLRIDPALDEIITRFYTETVGPYWSPERTLVDSGYAGIELPFDEQPVPSFQMEAVWSLPQLLGFLSTWSAVGRYRELQGADPLPALALELETRWGPPGAKRQIRWPLVVRAAKAPASRR